MIRRMLVVVVVGAALGCSNKPDEPTSRAAPGVADPNATYTIALRAPERGDKTEVNETRRTESTSTPVGGATGKREKQERRLEYTETVLEVPADGGRPTKLTRTYTAARAFDPASNTMMALPFEGKTITVAKTGGALELIADGKAPEFDTSELIGEFARPDRNTLDSVLPKKSVKVGEPWPLDASALKALVGELPFPVDPERSTVTGKLTKAYTKDGKQWGVLALDCDLAVSTPKAVAVSVTGALKISGTFDTVIDGTARDGTLTVTIKADVTRKEGSTEHKLGADLTATKTVKTVK